MVIASQRNKYKRTQHLTLLVAIAIHALAAAIFWNNEIKDVIFDPVIEIFQGKPQPPPPPPKTKISSPAILKPSVAPPKFVVHDKHSMDLGFMPAFAEFSALNNEVDPVNLSVSAKDYRTRDFNSDTKNSLNVAVNLLQELGVLDIMPVSYRTHVVNRGKRMRARMNLCLLSTPGASVLGPTGRKSINGKGGTEDTLRTVVTWDYVYKKYNAIDRARDWLKENTKILITDKTVTVSADINFTDWVYSVGKKGALVVDSGAGYFHESTALKRLENAIEGLERNRISGKRDFVNQVRGAVYKYIQSKYEVTDPDILTQDMLIKKIEERNILREWRKKGLLEVLCTINDPKDGLSKEELLVSLFPIYIFFKKAQILENPIVIISNPVGLEKVTDESMGILINYVKNGGFIWIDDTGIATANIKGQNEIARSFIHRLMEFDENSGLSDKEKETFVKLSAGDRDVQGFVLNNPFPEFAHPQVFIPISLPQDAPVSIKIFNRSGVPIKEFVWSRGNPMKAGNYIKKEQALVWDCDNNDREPVESGSYFVQMQSGLFQKTKILHISNLRKLDEKHPIMSTVHLFRNVPVCTIENSSRYWDTRPYGNAAFGYYYNRRMVILYTEGAGIVAGLGNLNNPVGKEMASKFLNNIIVFCLSDEDGITVRP